MDVTVRKGRDSGGYVLFDLSPSKVILTTAEMDALVQQYLTERFEHEAQAISVDGLPIKVLNSIVYEATSAQRLHYLDRDAEVTP